MIDTSAWKEFKISDLFDVKNSKSISDKRGLDFDENNPYDFIGRTPINNGIQGKIVKQGFEPNDENTFSVTQIGEKLCLFRDNKWYACQNIFLLTPLYSELVTIRFFICCIVTKTLKVVFGEDAYSSYPTKDTLSDMMVKLPATSEGQPDWNYMESYMKAVMEESEKTLSNLKKADDTKHLIDVSRWGEFRIGDVFDVVKGSRLTKADMKDGVIKFIGSSAINNGETHRIANDEKIHPANTITVCYNGSVGETFYQDERFWASDDVNVLYPKFNMTKLVAMFICPIIKSIGQKYAFIDKWKQEDMKNDIIKLPITSTGEPDWQYMENYMKGQFEKSELVIKELRSRI